MIDKIPKDVELAATYALDAIHRSDSQYEWQAIIARAILAERKRCAEVARQMLVYADTTSRADKEIYRAIMGDA